MSNGYTGTVKRSGGARGFGGAAHLGGESLSVPLPPVERAGGARLHWLRLSRNSLTCDAGVMLAEALGSPGGASLRHLDLSEVRNDVSHQD